MTSEAVAAPKIRFYNTLTKRKEDFEPLVPGKVRMYHCGPTVYAPAHIGNMTAFLLGDLLRRTLELFGYDVLQVMNITDVGHMTRDDVADCGGEDRLERRAREQGLTPWDLARKYTWLFVRDLELLGIKAAHVNPRATEFVPEMIAIIERLVAKGLAYQVPGGDVYFDVTKFPAYGRLSGNTLEQLEAGARVEVREEKRHPADFALWKVDPKHIMQWDSPFGRGFPGWHIECSAMSMRFLGETFDIHTGGEDNIFPHHECEIAQSEGATGKPFVRHWLHTRFLLVEGKKMAKREGNFFTLGDLVDRGFKPREVRYLLLSTHYRSQANFTFEGLRAARAALARLDELRERVEQARALIGMSDMRVAEACRAARDAFYLALGDDLNVSEALAALFNLVREVNRATFTSGDVDIILRTLRCIDSVLGVIFVAEEKPAASTASVSPDWARAEELKKRRDDARKRRDFGEADRLRHELAALGFVIKDKPDGTSLMQWRG
jgi:cysteinyl-tRNA synthetase